MKFVARLFLVFAMVVAPSLSHAAAGAWTITNAFKTRILNGGGLDLDTDTIQVALVASTSNIVSGPADCYTGGTGTAVTGELSTANGYTAGGQTVTTPALSGTSTVSYTNSAIPPWTASGGSIVARWAVMYDSTAASKTIIAYALLDSTPADVTVTTGNTLTISSATVFTLAYEYLYPSPLQVSANDDSYVLRKQG